MLTNFRPRAIAATLVLLSAFLVHTEQLSAALAAPAQEAKPPASRPAAAATRSGDVQRLDDLLEPIRQENRLPALAAAVTRRDGLVASGAVGLRRIGGQERVSADDCFHIGSCAKSMTATLCAVLVDEGKLRWDMTIEQAFPELKGKVLPEYLPVTLEQLLLHQSGLPEDRQPGPEFMKVAALKGDMREQRRAMVEIALSQRPAAEPGKKMLYSNFGYAIAGAMCEQATGKTWEDLMRERIFRPLGMTTAGFGPPGDRERVDQPFGHRGGSSETDATAVPPGPRADNPAVLGPGGSVHCSLEDWAKYAALHLGGDGRAIGLKPGSIEKLHAKVREEGYAFGWGQARDAWHGADVYQHAGSNTMWFALIQVSPKRDLAVLVATNCASKEAHEACGNAAKKLAERFDGPP